MTDRFLCFTAASRSSDHPRGAGELRRAGARGARLRIFNHPRAAHTPSLAARASGRREASSPFSARLPVWLLRGGKPPPGGVAASYETSSWRSHAFWLQAVLLRNKNADCASAIDIFVAQQPIQNLSRWSRLEDKMARPRKAPDKRLSGTIGTRFTPDQLRKLESLHQRYGLSRSAAVRQLVETAEIKIVTIPEANVEAISLLRKIGGLLAALLKKFPTEASDLRTLRRQALNLARYFAGEKQP
jgi:hypothetical protein